MARSSIPSFLRRGFRFGPKGRTRKRHPLGNGYSGRTFHRVRHLSGWITTVFSKKH